jgi:hypothetical protein
MPAITSKSCSIRFSGKTSSKGACTWKVWLNVNPLFCTPESHSPSGLPGCAGSRAVAVSSPNPLNAVAGLNEDRSRSEFPAALADLNSNGGSVCPLAGKQRRDDNKKCNAASAWIHSLTSIDVTLLPSFLESKQRHRFLSS